MTPNLVSTKTKKFPGGVTTAYILDEGATYSVSVVSVITRLDHGSYLVEEKKTGITPKEALGIAEYYTR